MIVSIVEGQGEVLALPTLLRRIISDKQLDQDAYIPINPPIRIKSGSFLNDFEYFSKYVNLAAAKASTNSGGVLILLDCDDDCPAQLGPQLLAQAQQVRADVTYLVALAHREYESWFIAGISSLAGFYGIPNNVAPPPVIESFRDAKGWVSNQMNEQYDPITHQEPLSKHLDFTAARNSVSFRRLYDKIDDLI